MTKSIKIILTSLGLCSVLIYLYFEQSKAHDLEVYYLDVGQGDSILIRTPENQDILIDGGPDDQVLQRLGEILPFWDRDIELMILTHPHDDHVAGLVPVLEKYQVDHVWYSEVDYDNPNYQEFTRLIAEKNIYHQSVFYGQVLNLNQLELKVLYPYQNLDLSQIENINNISTILKLTYQDSNFLFTGDAEQEVEVSLLENQIDPSAQVLKAGHHGSKTASTKEFLIAVSPEQVIISCGQANKFKHPHFITLFNLQELNMPFFRTDQDGTIKCSSDGSAIKCYNLGI